MIEFDDKILDWNKMNGLIPAIIQNAQTGQVLMLGYMNPESLRLTRVDGDLTLFSRSRNELWRKGETSGNRMQVVNISTDCDQDSLLILVKPLGPACHLGFDSCYQTPEPQAWMVLNALVNLVEARSTNPTANSYTWDLLQAGLPRAAQKVGEEAVEVVIASMKGDQTELMNECADLLYHLLILLHLCELPWTKVLTCLKDRMS